MKKITKNSRKLVVSHETIRRLSAMDMRAVNGGYRTSEGNSCNTLAEDCPTTSDYTNDGHC